MTTTLVLAADASRLWSHPRSGDLVMWPFPSGRTYRVVEVFSNGDVALDSETAQPTVQEVPE